MRNMVELGKNSLIDEELHQVSGGWTDNGDGTYNIFEGETFHDGYLVYRVVGNYSHIGLDRFIDVMQFAVDDDGNLMRPSIDCKMSLGSLIKLPAW